MKEDLKNYIDLDYKKFSERIIYTNREVIGVRLPILKKYAKDNKDNLDLIYDNTYHENTIINAYIINTIKDYDLHLKYLLYFIDYIDNWATCDTLKFNIKDHELDYFNLSKELIKSKNTYYRRVGLRILFSFKNNKSYLDRIIKLINSLYLEKEYYVNMCNAWLLCELTIFNKDYIINNLNNLKLNDFTKSKFVSKCYDSFRIDRDTVKILKEWKNE